MNLGTKTCGLVGVLSLIVLSACTAGPDHRAVQIRTPERFTADPMPAHLPGSEIDAGPTPTQALVPAEETPEDWWTSFGSPELNALVREAMARNPSVAAAEAALRQAQEAVAVQSAAWWPSLQATYTPQRARVSSATSSPLNSGASVYTLHTAQLNIGYVPDLFGANRRAVESARAQMDGLRWQARAARLSLQANVVAASIQEAALREQLSLAERQEDAAVRLLALSATQQRMGETAGMLVRTQEAQRWQAAAAVHGLRKQLAQNHDQLAALLGYSASELPPMRLRMADLALPDVPVALPAGLLQRRPDILAAEAQVRAANAQVGMAVAAMLPQLSVGISYGDSATALSQLFRASGLLWSVGLNATQTLFDAGANQHRLLGAEAQRDLQVAQYQQTVLAAFQNVADCLEALRHDATQAEATVAQDRATLATLRSAERQFELGDISRLALLNAEIGAMQSSMVNAQVRALRLGDVAALYLALGGSWADTEPVAAAARQ